VELKFLVRFQAGVPNKMNKENKLIPGLPPGFEDRWNKKLILKKKLINIIENNFIKFGFEPLETPSFEISENIGSFLADEDNNLMSDVFSFMDGDKQITLRYDLSSPLARFIAQNNQQLALPYKRYAIQNVFRNEKGGNARYREFTQADCDIVGNVNPAQANTELCNLISSTLLECGLKKNQFTVNISNRKIVQGLIAELKISEEKEIKVMRAIDKLDKPGFGLKGVEDLLKKQRVDISGAITKGADLSNDEASQIIEFLKVKNLQELKDKLKNPLSQEGIKELEDLLEVASYGDYLDQIKTNFTIVRGLAYYDGFCVETNLNFKAKNNKDKEVDIGSICSGGQYNKLISRFKGVDFPGTGISIGVDRLLFAMMQLDQIKAEVKRPVIVCVMDEKYLKNYYDILKVLRDNNINSEIFLDSKKNLGKQLTYANKKECPVAVICGENEFKDNTITLKNLLGVKGENNQLTISREKLINEIKKFI
jgi:histidyl-tRNA synthetase